METVEPQRPDGGSLLRPTSRTSPSIFYNMRAPPRYWIANATDMVEPRGPDSGQHVRIEGDFLGRSGSVVIEESRKETQHAGSAQIWDCSSPTYFNKHCRTYSTTCGLRPDIGLLPQRTWSSLGGQIQVSMSKSKTASVGAQAVSTSTSPGRKHYMRAPPRYWIPTATDNVEPRRPDSGQHVGTEGHCRGRSGTGVIIAEKSKTNAAIAEAATTTGAPTAGEGAKETSEAQNFRRWKTQR